MLPLLIRGDGKGRRTSHEAAAPFSLKNTCYPLDTSQGSDNNRDMSTTITRTITLPEVRTEPTARVRTHGHTLTCLLHATHAAMEDMDRDDVASNRADGWIPEYGMRFSDLMSAKADAHCVC